MNILQIDSALGCFGNDVHGQSQRMGKAKHVDMQNFKIQEASKSGRFAMKKVDTSLNPVVLMTKPIPMSLMGYEFVSATAGTSKGQATMTQWY